MRALVIALVSVSCGKATDPSSSAPSNRGTGAPIVTPQADTDHFEGTLSGHRFTITIARGKLTASDRTAYTWSVDRGRLVVSDSGPIAEETRYLVERSPRTIVRGSDGLWVVTEVVTTSGGRVFTCLHQEPIAMAGSAEAKQAAARGVAACSSLRVDPK
jgi:hypothetical protein